LPNPIAAVKNRLTRPMRSGQRREMIVTQSGKMMKRHVGGVSHGKTQRSKNPIIASRMASELHRLCDELYSTLISGLFKNVRNLF
jgi:hypothetical protein